MENKNKLSMIRRIIKTGLLLKITEILKTDNNMSVKLKQYE